MLETKKYIEDAGIVLDIRDIEKEPLTEQEIGQLVGYFDIRHFLNPMSKAFTDAHLDKKLPDRDEIIKLIAADHSLLRRPIIRTSRLMTVGCDRSCIDEMLELNSNGTRPQVPARGNSARGSGGRGGHSRSRAAASSGR